MLIKIGRIKIDTESRVNKHKDYLYNSIRLLHQEIIDLVMDGETKNRLAI